MHEGVYTLDWFADAANRAIFDRIAAARVLGEAMLRTAEGIGLRDALVAAVGHVAVSMERDGLPPEIIVEFQEQYGWTHEPLAVRAQIVDACPSPQGESVMSGSLNKAQLIGHLGRDPDIRTTGEGKRVAVLSVATSERWTDRASGEKRERTEWHRVVVFNEGLVEVAQKYAHKGSKVYVEGMLRTRRWTDKNDVERFSTEIVLSNYGAQLTLLDRRPGTAGGADEDTSDETPSSPPPRDEEIPF